MDNPEQPQPTAAPANAVPKPSISKAPAFTVKPWEATFKKGGQAGFSGPPRGSAKSHSTKKK